jgi:sec-independent protein translocase protein TatB
MFDIGWTELLVIAVVAIVVVGPKDLPRALRYVGQWTGRMKRMARDFQNQFNEAIREAELENVKKDIEEIGKIDPLADARKDMAAIEASLKADPEKKPDTKTDGAAAPATAPAETPAASSEATVSASEPAKIEPPPTPEAEPVKAEAAAPATPAIETAASVSATVAGEKS